MTVEHKIIVGLNDITAVVFECESCQARSVFKPDSLTFPPTTCPNKHAWNWNVEGQRETTASPFFFFLKGLATLRSIAQASLGFKVFLEFKDPINP
jgi:hypothetical protein